MVSLKGYLNTAELTKSATAGLIAGLLAFVGVLGADVSKYLDPAVAGLGLTLIGFAADAIRRLGQGRKPTPIPVPPPEPPVSP